MTEPEQHARFLTQSIRLAVESAQSGRGGPFGAVIVRSDNGQIIGEGANQVTRTNDPTAHAEIVAIRQACRALESFSLAGCTLYASCEPCPMCLGAIYWARLDHVFFAATREDAARAGFDDAHIYHEVARPLSERTLPITHLAQSGALAPFSAWAEQRDRVPY